MSGMGGVRSRGGGEGVIRRWKNVLPLIDEDELVRARWEFGESGGEKSTGEGGRTFINFWGVTIPLEYSMSVLVNLVASSSFCALSCMG